MTNSRYSEDYLQTLGERFSYAAFKRPAYWQSNDNTGDRVGIDVRGWYHRRQWMERVITEAKKSPTARQALAWAAAHGINIRAVGSLEKGVLGEYAYDGEIKILYRPNSHLARAVDTLVHEIRHAWQDHHGILYNKDYQQLSLSDKIIMNALFEADALAMGRLARRECMKGVINVDAFLQGNFQRWFDDHAQGYHEGEVSHHLRYNKPTIAQRLREVFTGVSSRPTQYAVVDWQTYLHKLGRKFDGSNYIAKCDDLRDFIATQVLPRGCGLKKFESDARFDDVSATEDKRQRLVVVKHTNAQRRSAANKN